MATPVDDSRIIRPFMPTLFHIVVVKVAFPMFKEFNSGIWDRVYTDIQKENSAATNEGRKENLEVIYNRAKEKLLSIPAHLRKRVLEAIHGLEFEVKQWRSDHARIYLHEKWILYWSADGTIDRTKTMQKLVQNKDINIVHRFEIACMYSLRKNIRALWFEIEASDEVEYLKPAYKSMSGFWLKWGRYGSWTRAVLEYIHPPPRLSRRSQTVRFSSLLPSLQPEDREKFLFSLKFAVSDDFRFCLYALTKEEQEQMVERDVFQILVLHLSWPLQSLFLETAEKMWIYIDVHCFLGILKVIINQMEFKKDFDYLELLGGFWNRSPNHFKVKVREDFGWNKRIDYYFEGRRLKENADDG